MFAVIETKDNIDTLVGYIESFDDFKTFILDHKTDYQYIEGGAIFESKQVVKQGYIYNSVVRETKCIASYKMIPIDVKKYIPSYAINQFIGKNNLIIGHRASGKTVVLKAFLQSLSVTQLKNTTVVVYNDESANDYIEFTKHGCEILLKHEVTPGYFINKQYANYLEQGFVLFDDSFEASNFKHLHNLIQTIKLAKYFNLTTLTTIQYPWSFPTNIRKMFNIVVAFSEHSQSNIRRLYDTYANFYPTFDAFNDKYTDCTNEQYSAMLIDAKNTKTYKFKV